MSRKFLITYHWEMVYAKQAWNRVMVICISVKRFIYQAKHQHLAPKRHTPNLIVLLYAAAIFINISLRSVIPVNAAFSSPHDDELGIHLSSNILKGEWLGAWDNRTLAKPSGYSIYLALTHYIPLPLVVINQTIYIIVVFLLINRVQKLFVANFKGKRILLFLVFTFMIFQPILFEPDANRIYRSSVPLITLTLLFSVTLFGIFQKIDTFGNFPMPHSQSRKKFYFDVVVLSLTYACLVLFRFESFSLLICSLPLISLALARKYFQLGAGKQTKKAFLKMVFIATFAALISYSTPLYAIGEANRTAYGVALSENYFQGSFSKAINLWASVDVGRDPRPYVIVSAEQRNAVYKISKNASLMKPYLEAKNNGWNKIACDTIQLCDNSGSWFTWQVRDAAVQTGLVNSEKTFQKFFDDLANDIFNSCSSLEFNCGRTANLVGSKPLFEISKSKILQYSILNFKILIPLESNDSQKLTKPDTYGAPQSVVKLFHEIVDYESANFYTGNRLQVVSRSVNLMNSFFLVFNLMIYSLALLGICIGFCRRLSTHLKFIITFLVLGVVSQLVGVSVAQISIGNEPGGKLYLLSAYPLLHMLAVIGACVLAISLADTKSFRKLKLLN